MTTGSLSQYLMAKKSKGKKLLISYLVAGYPSLPAFPDILSRVLEVSDVVEIGYPFSDPLADGTTIQKASQKVLQKGWDYDRFFDLLSPVTRQTQKPVILMSYLNPLLRYGLEKASGKLAEMNFKGALFPDLPVEEGKSIQLTLNRFGLEVPYLLSPATSLKRAREIVKRSQGFVYLVSLKGVTGARRGIPTETIDYLKTIRRVCEKPLYVGFGISKPEQVAQLAPFVDGVIVGSALLEHLGRDGGGLLKAERFLKALKERL